MSWLDDFFGSSPSQQPGNPSGESDADRRMREHDQAVAQLRADRKLRQVLASQEADRTSAPFDPRASTRTDQVSLGMPAAPDWVGSYVGDNPFGSTASNPAAGYLAWAKQTTPHAWTDANGTTVNINDGRGTLETRRGGNLTWRDNNPGNMNPDMYSRGHHQVGTNFNCQTCGDKGFAIFPDYQHGLDASIDKLSRSPNYNGGTLGDAIAVWVPHRDRNGKIINDTAAYQSAVASLTGIPLATPMSRLSRSQLSSVMDAFQIREGKAAGNSTSWIWNPF